MKYPESIFIQSCEGCSANIELLISNKMMGFHIKSKENPFERRQCYFSTFDKSAYLIILNCHYIACILAFSFKSLCHDLSFNLSGVFLLQKSERGTNSVPTHSSSDIFIIYRTVKKCDFTTKNLAV